MTAATAAMAALVLRPTSSGKAAEARVAALVAALTAGVAARAVTLLELGKASSSGSPRAGHTYRVTPMVLLGTGRKARLVARATVVVAVGVVASLPLPLCLTLTPLPCLCPPTACRMGAPLLLLQQLLQLPPLPLPLQLRRTASQRRLGTPARRRHPRLVPQPPPAPTAACLTVLIPTPPLRQQLLLV